MILANPLLDKQFIIDLSEKRDRILYARITSLTYEEKPVEHIEGKVTGGSISIDGASAVRRTCSLSMVAKEVNINSFYWGLSNKFKLELGLQNNINLNYEDIIWFPMGMYIINSFNTSLTSNNYNINISGKDKMCMLNGDVGGSLPHTTDFGVIETYDKESNTTTYEKVLIKNIIREAVQHFGNELPQNIIINDIEDCGVEIIEYKGDEPLYLYFNKKDQVVDNLSFGTQPIVINGVENTINNFGENIIFDNFTEDLTGAEDSPTVITLPGDTTEYTLIKLEYGSVCGYRETDLVYAGELIVSIGEAITSVLDKIVNMLGQFEYFYDLDGRFIFQKKKIYLDSVWNDLDIDAEVGHYNDSTYDYSFTNSNLITSFSNTPNLLNVRNDFAVWGTKQGTGDIELPIHMRYAIDKKPDIYYSFRHLLNKDEQWAEGTPILYSAKEYDWRELIYQMALDYRRCYHNDDFLYYLSKYNPQYPTGKTGYEQYYVDMEGFWRQLYDPSKGAEYIGEVETQWNNEAIDYDNQIVEKETILLDADIALQQAISEKDTGNRVYETIAEAQDAVDLAIQEIDSNKEDIEDKYSEEKAKLNENKKAENYNSDMENLEEWYDIETDKLITKKVQINNCFSAFKTAFNNLTNVKKQKENQQAYYDGLKETEKESWDDSFWNTTVLNSPGDLLFWFDFLDGGLAQFSNYAIGNRPKSEKDDDVKTIIYSDIPNVIFQTQGIDKEYEREPGYTYISIPEYMYNVFSISSISKSAKEAIDEMLYKYGYCNESVSISAIPVYFLEPNARVYIRDDNSGINGEYIVDKITIPLNNNGTMSITATKAISSLT